MRPQLQLPIFRSCRDPPARNTSAIDKWLVRLSHLSQFGLLLFTVGTIYFTVVPLYQKALLEEAIAKKEIDLIEATNRLKSTEHMLNSAQTKLSEINSALSKTKVDLTRAQLAAYIQQLESNLSGFVFLAGADCTGLLVPPEQPNLDAKPKPREVFEKLFDLSPGDCIHATFQKSKLRTELRAADLNHLEQIVASLQKLVGERKAEALKASNELVQTAQRDPKLLRPTSPADVQMDAFLSSIRVRAPTAEEQRKLEFGQSILRTRNSIAYDYLQSVRDSVSSLRKTAWPINTNSMP